MAEKLTEVLVKDLAAPEKGNRIVYDSEVKGFGVRLTPSGAKAFILNYRFDDPDDRSRRSSEYRYTIGAFGPHDWSVAAARKEAAAWRRKIDRGETHPLAEKRGRRAAVENAREAERARQEAETFEDAVKDYIKREQKGRRRNVTADEVERALLKGCADWLKRPVAEIEAREVRKLLETVRDGDDEAKPRPYLANRLHAYLKTFFAWCAEDGVDKVPASPMATLKRPWEGEETRQRVFSDDEIKALWKAADGIEGKAAEAFLKLLLLTGKRKSALAAMRWDEIDGSGLWTPPASNRRKKINKRLHGIPLPGLALRVIRPLKPAEDAKEPSPYVFAGRRRGSHLDPGTLLQKDIQRKSGVADFFYHAARHTVETRLAELGVPPHIRDILLDHAPARGAGAGYDHHHYRDEMLGALERWAGHVASLVAPKGTAVLR